jgi:hypothetical protein
MPHLAPHAASQTLQKLLVNFAHVLQAIFLITHQVSASPAKMQLITVFPVPFQRILEKQLHAHLA